MKQFKHETLWALSYAKQFGSMSFGTIRSFKQFETYNRAFQIACFSSLSERTWAFIFIALILSKEAQVQAYRSMSYHQEKKKATMVNQILSPFFQGNRPPFFQRNRCKVRGCSAERNHPPVGARAVARKGRVTRHIRRSSWCHYHEWHTSFTKYSSTPAWLEQLSCSHPHTWGHV